MYNRCVFQYFSTICIIYMGGSNIKPFMFMPWYGNIEILYYCTFEFKRKSLKAIYMYMATGKPIKISVK